MLSFSLSLKPPVFSGSSLFYKLEQEMEETPEVRVGFGADRCRYRSDTDYWFALVFPSFRRQVTEYYDMSDVGRLKDRYPTEKIEIFDLFLSRAWRIAAENEFQHGSRKFGVGKLQEACRQAAPEYKFSGLLVKGLRSLYKKERQPLTDWYDEWFEERFM